MTDTTATVDDLRKHVTDDAFELMATVCLVTPLVTGARISDPTKLLLRRVLSRHVVLVLTRMHAHAGTGPTGVTASIQGVLDALRAGSRHRPAEIDAFTLRRRSLLTNMEADGVSLKDVTMFRNSELAHSLHAHDPAKADIGWPTINTLANGTNDLVRAIEEAVVASGGPVCRYLGQTNSRRGPNTDVRSGGDQAGPGHIVLLRAAIDAQPGGRPENICSV
jgi:hypothetical protein